MSDAFARAINKLDEQAFQSLYGRWDPLEPAQVAKLFSAAPVRWWIAGGRAARAGAAARHHEDTDVAVRIDDLGAFRERLSEWDLWEAHNGTLRPLLPGDNLTPGCEQLWARRDAQHPWQLDLLLDRSHDQWAFKRDPRIRVRWQSALHTVDGIPYLRPELALLHKAHLDRPKDKADLAAARLDPDARAWLAQTLDQLGHHSWASAARSAGLSPRSPFRSGRALTWKCEHWPSGSYLPAYWNSRHFLHPFRHRHNPVELERRRRAERALKELPAGSARLKEATSP